MPSGRRADIGDEVGKTFNRQAESETRKKVEFAPESEMTVLGKGVVRDNEESIISVELRTTADISVTIDVGSPNTRFPYLMGLTHLELLPPAWLAAVAFET